MTDEELVEWLDEHCRQWVRFEPLPDNWYRLETDTGRHTRCHSDEFVHAVKVLNLVWSVGRTVWRREALKQQAPRYLPINNDDYEE